MKIESLKKVLVFILILLVPNIVVADVIKSNVDSDGRNTFYFDVLNFSMPLVKAVSYSPESTSESNITFTGLILKTYGIDIKNPFTILQKEASVFGVASPQKSDTTKDAIIDKDSSSKEKSSNQFAINQNDIKKESSTGTGSSEPFYDAKYKKTLNLSNPEVLIYHSHTTEAYPKTDINPAKGVCSVGDVVVNELENNYGIAAINDKTVHDIYSYYDSYKNSAVTLQNYLNKYKDFKLIIDMHRDGGPSKSSVTANIAGMSVAKFQIVLANKNPHFDKNLAVANKLLSISSSLFPGFSRETYYYEYGAKGGFFNQGMSNNAILLEVGADCNTLNEAQNSGKLLARIIAQYINGN